MSEQLPRGEEAGTEQSLTALKYFPSQKKVSLPSAFGIE